MIIYLNRRKEKRTLRPQKSTVDHEFEVRNKKIEIVNPRKRVRNQSMWAQSKLYVLRSPTERRMNG